jgi:transcriptional regulator with XRE-family HTH domain
VYELRKAAGLTQRQLAERMGTTASVIARLEGGGTSPTVATLSRLADAVGVRLELTVAGRAELRNLVVGLGAGAGR